MDWKEEKEARNPIIEQSEQRDGEFSFNWTKRAFLTFVQIKGNTPQESSNILLFSFSFRSITMECNEM